MDRSENDLASASDRVLREEQSELQRSVHALRLRAAAHRDVLEHLEAQLAREERLLREIEELSDRRPQLRLERLDRQLKGRRIQEVAVEVLRLRLGPGQAIHYREWFSMLRAEGFEIAGRDPLNSFLTSVSRAEKVERVGTRTGLYQLR